MSGMAAGAKLVALAAALGALLAAPAAAWDELMVLATDYTTVAMARSVGRRAPWPVSGDLEPVPVDPVARWHAGLYYVVGRGGSNLVQVLDPLDGYATVRQFSVGAGRNPQDIAFRADGIAFVSCYDTAELLKVDARTGNVLASFSTAAFADADGLPETAWLQAVDGSLYVVCQRLDRQNWYLPTGPSHLAVFDLAAEAWVDVAPGTPGLDAIVLAGANPYGAPALSPERTRLRLPCTGAWGALDGGVEVVDLPGRASLGFEVAEAALGGDLVAFVPGGPSRSFAIVSDASFHTCLVVYDPAPGGAVASLACAPAYDYAHLAGDGAGLLYLADRGASAPGLRVFDVATGAELTSAPLSTGLPPAWIALPVDPSLTAVGDGPAAAAALALEPPWPNPANPGCRVALRGRPEAEVRIAVADLRGRRLAAGSVRLDRAGVGTWRFDGRDAAGRELPSGRYLIEARQGTARAQGGFLLLR